MHVLNATLWEYLKAEEQFCLCDMLLGDCFSLGNIGQRFRKSRVYEKEPFRKSGDNQKLNQSWRRVGSP